MIDFNSLKAVQQDWDSDWEWRYGNPADNVHYLTDVSKIAQYNCERFCDYLTP